MKEKKRFLLRYLILGILGVVCYEILGVMISYIRQPEVGQEYLSDFRVSDYYSQKISPERAYILEDNEEALEERLRLIAHAKERIILSTFEFRSDKSGKDMLAALLDASQRGVEVQILLDGFAAVKNQYGNPYFQALSTRDNVEIRIYNPVNLLTPWKLMGRMHDKYLIADADLYILGGRNTYDYFLGDNGYKNYDRDVLVYNTAADAKKGSLKEVLEYFRGVWNYKACEPFYNDPAKALNEEIQQAVKELNARYRGLVEERPETFETGDYMEKTYETTGIHLLSNPITVYPKEPEVFYALFQLMREAKEEVDIHTPYIICNQMMYDSFARICQGQADVRLMTNSVANNGNPFGASDYHLHKDKLLKTGLEILEYEGGVSYHGKSITIDDDMALVGSFNMDMRSAYLDTELMLAVNSPGVTAQLKKCLETYEKDSVRAINEKEYGIPEGVVRQEITPKRKFRMYALTLFNWLRFLM